MIPVEFPENEAELYDLLQEMFGIGTYDEVAGSEAWFRARMVEVMKLKGLCRRRRASARCASSTRGSPRATPRSRARSTRSRRASWS